jgi:hypothetical protein
VTLLFGDGTGNFPSISHISSTNPGNSEGLKLGDVNGDGKVDLVTASSNTLTVQFGDGAGNFAAGTDYPIAYGGYSVTLADLDSDGDLDAFNDSIFWNNGDGTFSAEMSIGSNGRGYAAGDINGDGILDFVDGRAGGADFYIQGTTTTTTSATIDLTTVSGAQSALALATTTLSTIDLERAKCWRAAERALFHGFSSLV